MADDEEQMEVDKEGPRFVVKKWCVHAALGEIGRLRASLLSVRMCACAHQERRHLLVMGHLHW
jgi:hypothetical protein